MTGRRFLMVCTLLMSLSSVRPAAGVAPAEAEVGGPVATRQGPAVVREAPVEQWSRAYRVPKAWVQAVWAYESHIHSGKFTQLTGPNRPLWLGLGNPGLEDAPSIFVFEGVGRDGDGDGRCDIRSARDRTCAVLDWLSRNGGTTAPEIRRSLWQWYEDSVIVERITLFSSLFATHTPAEMSRHAFPLPLRSSYTYRNTWGQARGWGGRRIHVGTDLFAPYGTPVRSTVWGYVETTGWNPYGGWRIGIRDIDNTYHYFAHLSGYAKGLSIGQIVKPGQVIGYVGSSGYGRKGTSGKFPPHLHYGMYVDAGSEEWPVNPYPNLVQWEREERKQTKR